jgi:hypothetical protein
MLMDRNIAKTLSEIQGDIGQFPTYFYPPLIIYYSWIRNVFDEKMRIYKEYKLTLMDAEQNETNLKEITSENLYQDTICMEVSLECHNFGNIIRVSPDYFVF